MLTAEALRAARQRAQLLTDWQPGDVAGAVQRLGAVQAQLASAAGLALRARTVGTTAVDVERARADRSVTCTWALRGTLHLVAAQDVRWMVDLLGPVNAARGRRRRETLGLDGATCERGVSAIAQVLGGSAPLTRAELLAGITQHGVVLDPASQAPAHLVAYAANTGVLCRGPDTAGDATYVLLDEWVPRRGAQRNRTDALAELARRYLAAHAPAAVGDFTAWSGLPVTDGRRAFELIADELTRVETDLGALYAQAATDPDAAPPAPPRLLGHFDPLLLGYRSRALLLDPTRAKAIQAGGGFIRPAVLVGGRVAGTWRLERAGKTASVVVEPFGRLPDNAGEALRAEADDVVRFLGQEVGSDLAH